ncbi:hypothetical protein LTR50_007201 [Elasticomyces elasticus]|nr:hypothetical protein LTR50_007201 [Elasticomyces elasticus]
MSSMRNAVQRRNHRERAQPKEREKWGLLEKHKDYSLRAKDHNLKRQRLKALSQKAADRNPDEFAFGMMSARTRDGIKLGSGSQSSLSVDVAKLLKTQDAGYLRTVLQQTRKERERAEQAAVLGTAFERREGGGQSGRRKVFDEDGTPREPVQMQTVAEVEAVRQDALNTSPAAVAERRGLKKKAREQEVRDRRLEVLQEREKELTTALDELDTQRAKMAGTVGGTDRNGVKWKVRERKR